MSVAAAVRKRRTIAIAADTQENFGDRKMLRGHHHASKILRVGSSYVAQSGWGIYENILGDHLAKSPTPRLRNEREIFMFFNRFWRELRRKYSYVNDQPDEDDKTPFAELDATFLIVNASGIFHVSGNMSVTAFDRYYAIGSGASYALGAMHALYETDLLADEISRRACTAATEFDIYCGGELDNHVVRL